MLDLPEDPMEKRKDGRKRCWKNMQQEKLENEAREKERLTRHAEKNFQQ